MASPVALSELRTCGLCTQGAFLHLTGKQAQTLRQETIELSPITSHPSLGQGIQEPHAAAIFLGTSVLGFLSWAPENSRAFSLPSTAFCVPRSWHLPWFVLVNRVFKVLFSGHASSVPRRQPSRRHQAPCPESQKCS